MALRESIFGDLQDETVFFENVGGPIGIVELKGDDVILTYKQLETMALHGILKGEYKATRIGDNRYLVSLKKNE